MYVVLAIAVFWSCVSKIHPCHLISAELDTEASWVILLMHFVISGCDTVSTCMYKRASVLHHVTKQLFTSGNHKIIEFLFYCARTYVCVYVRVCMYMVSQ